MWICTNCEIFNEDDLSLCCVCDRARKSKILDFSSESYKARTQPWELNSSPDLAKLSDEEIFDKNRKLAKHVERLRYDDIKIVVPRDFRIIALCIYCKTKCQQVFTGVQWKCMVCSHYYESGTLSKVALAAIATG